MANTKAEYFVPSNWDFPPNGPIALGSVITTLKNPHRRLALCLPDDDDVLPSTKLAVSIEKEKFKSGGFSVLTTFMSGLLGLGVDVGADWEKSDAKTFTFDRMDTTQFVPKHEYVKRCVDDAAVRRFLETSRYRKSVYIITGVKVVTGAQGATNTSRTVEGMVGAQVDGTVLSAGMVPIGGGPEYRHGRTTKGAVSWEGSSDFVFAYKVSEVRVSKSGEIKRERDYTKGALYEDNIKKHELEPLDVSLVGSPSSAAKQDFSTEILEDGCDTITYGIPVPKDDSD